MSPDLRESCDVAVVGAGPAGLAAADLCARAGLETLLLDEQADPGGQIYRAVTASPLAPGTTILGDDYWRGGAFAPCACKTHHSCNRRHGETIPDFRLDSAGRDDRRGRANPAQIIRAGPARANGAGGLWTAALARRPAVSQCL